MTEHNERPSAGIDNDPEILFPDEMVTIGGEQIEVREFRYLEGLRAIALAKPLIAELAKLLEGGDIDAIALDALIANHYQAWIEMISMSTGKPVSWVEELRDRDGQALGMTFWRVNSGFFMRRLVFGGALARAMQQLVNPPLKKSGSPKFSTPSSSPATDTTPPTSPSA